MKESSRGEGAQPPLNRTEASLQRPSHGTYTQSLPCHPYLQNDNFAISLLSQGRKWLGMWWGVTGHNETSAVVSAGLGLSQIWNQALFCSAVFIPFTQKVKLNWYFKAGCTVPT